MKKWLIAALLALGLAPRADATTFYVTNDTRMVSVMDSVVAGDIVQINDGAYTKCPSFDPQYKVSPATVGSRITIIGNLGSPLAVSVPGFRGGNGTTDTTGNMVHDYCTWKGITFRRGLSINGSPYDPQPNHDPGALGDSIINCRFYGGFDLNYMGQTIIKDCSFGMKASGMPGGFVNASMHGGWQPNYGFGWGGGNKMINCHLDGRKDANTKNEGLIFDGGDTQDATVTPDDPFLLDSLTLTTCYFSVVQVGASCTGAAAEGSRGMKIRNFGYNQISNTSFRLVDSTTCTGTPSTTGVPAIILHIRDKVIQNVFNTDSILASGNWAQGRFDLTTSGNSPPVPDPSNNKWLSCLFRNLSKSGTNPYGHAIRWDVADDSTTYSRCSFLAGPQAGFIVVGPMTSNAVQGMLFDHCVFYGDSIPNGAGRIIQSGAMTVKNSIFYAPRHTNTTTARALEFTSTAGANYTANWNAYFSPANRANSVYRTSTFFPPGNTLFALFGDDSNSVYGSPKFTDSTLTAFNPLPISGAITLLAGEGGSTIGPTESAADTLRPFAMNDLLATGGVRQVALAWTPTGDDSLAGIANHYDLRVSTSAITAGNFAAAAQATTPVPTARAAGLQYVTIPNLLDNTTYYVAIIIYDEAGNPSAISNLPSATTNSPGGGGTSFFPTD